MILRSPTEKMRISSCRHGLPASRFARMLSTWNSSAPCSNDAIKALLGMIEVPLSPCFKSTHKKQKEKGCERKEPGTGNVTPATRCPDASNKHPRRWQDAANPRTPRSVPRLDRHHPPGDGG